MNPADINRTDQGHLSSGVYGLLETLEVTAQHQTDHVRHRLTEGKSALVNRGHRYERYLAQTEGNISRWLNGKQVRVQTTR